jgi:hypothetical protein
MADPSTTDFLTRFPEFAELSTSVVAGALAEAARVIPDSVWTTTRTEGITYLAAHLLATRSMQIGIQVGSPSGAPAGQQLDSTLYGQEYRRLRDTLPLTGFAI